MIRTRILGPALAVVAALALSACAGGSTPAATSESPAAPVIAPVTMAAGDLQGASVDLVVGQVLNIDTGDLAVDSYSAEVADPSVAEFVQGREDGSATFNPGFEALAEGSTDVTLVNAAGGIQPLEFTIEVSAR